MERDLKEKVVTLLTAELKVTTDVKFLSWCIANNVLSDDAQARMLKIVRAGLYRLDEYSPQSEEEEAELGAILQGARMMPPHVIEAAKYVVAQEFDASDATMLQGELAQWAVGRAKHVH